MVAVALGIVGVLFARSGTGQRLLGETPDKGGTASGVAVTIAGAKSFDPDGDGSEHEDEVSHLFDSDPTTTWSTSRYGGPHFGGPQAGRGIRAPARRCPPVGWAEGERGQQRLERRGSRVRDRPPEPGRLGPGGGRQGGDRRLGHVRPGRADRLAVLVWITDPGGGNTSVTVGEVEVTGG